MIASHITDKSTTQGNPSICQRLRHLPLKGLDYTLCILDVSFWVLSFEYILSYQTSTLECPARLESHILKLIQCYLYTLSRCHVGWRLHVLIVLWHTNILPLKQWYSLHVSSIYDLFKVVTLSSLYVITVSTTWFPIQIGIMTVLPFAMKSTTISFHF